MVSEQRHRVSHCSGTDPVALFQRVEDWLVNVYHRVRLRTDFESVIRDSWSRKLILKEQH